MASFQRSRIVGHGVDLVEIARIAELRHAHPDRFLQRVYAETERKAAGAASATLDQFLAGRFAVKEAVLKALGTGLTGGLSWTEIVVEREPTGRPRLSLTGAALTLARSLGVTRWEVSISHTRSVAMASVLAIRDEGD